jgi:hypothetical protein
MTICNSSFELSEVPYVKSSPEISQNNKSEPDYCCIANTVAAVVNFNYNLTIKPTTKKTAFKKHSPVVKEDKISVLISGHGILRHNTRVKVAFVESDTAHPHLQPPLGRPSKNNLNLMLKLQQNIVIFGLPDPNTELIPIKNCGKTLAHLYSM